MVESVSLIICASLMLFLYSLKLTLSVFFGFVLYSVTCHVFLPSPLAFLSRCQSGYWFPSVDLDLYLYSKYKNTLKTIPVPQRCLIRYLENSNKMQIDNIQDFFLPRYISFFNLNSVFSVLKYTININNTKHLASN